MTPFRAVLSWFVLLAVAFLNGAVRQFAYPSTLGDFAARQVAAGVGAVALGVTIWFILRRWPLSRAPQAWATGALWAALTVAFEVALVRGGGRPWDDVIAQYALWKGSLWPLLVLWVLAAPAALSALQRSGIAAHRPGARGEPAGLAVGALGRVLLRRARADAAAPRDPAAGGAGGARRAEPGGDTGGVGRCGRRDDSGP
jgi:hypothetical protein